MVAREDGARGSSRKRSTTSRQTNAALQRSEARYRALLEALPDMVFRVGADGTYLDFVPAKGLEPYASPEDFLGKRMAEVLPQDVAEVALSAIERALETGETQTIEVDIPRQDETLTNFEARIVALNDEALVVVRDVTLARRMERELERNRALVQVVADSMVVAAFVHQNDRVVYANRAAADITGYAMQGELLGRSFLAMVHADDRELVSTRRDARLAGKSEPARYEFRLVRKDGEERWVDCSIGALVDFEGAPAIVGTAIDITERKRNEEELRQARDELERQVERRIPPESSYGLTFRELMVLSLASNGQPDTDIAAILGISHRTVEAHMSNLLRKMSARSRTEACVRAQREKIID